MMFSREDHQKVNAKIHEIEQELRKWTAVKHAMRNICPHDMVASGHDSHYSYESCTICGWEEKA